MADQLDFENIVRDPTDTEKLTREEAIALIFSALESDVYGKTLVQQLTGPAQTVGALQIKGSSKAATKIAGWANKKWGSGGLKLGAVGPLANILTMAMTLSGSESPKEIEEMGAPGAIAKIIVDELLPEEARYGSVMMQLDLRPLLAATTTSDHWKEAAKDYDLDPDDSEASAQTWVDHYMSQLDAAYDMGDGKPIGWEPGKVTINPAAKYAQTVPTLDPMTGQMSTPVDPITGEATEYELSDTDGDGIFAYNAAEKKVTKVRPFDRNAVRRVARDNNLGMEFVAEAESEKNQEFLANEEVPGYVSAEVRYTEDRKREHVGDEDREGGNQPGLTAQEALGYFLKFSPRERATLRENMRLAGYFDKVGQMSSGTGWGDDEIDYEAWQHVLKDSLKSDVPIDQMLEGKIKQFQEYQKLNGLTATFDKRGRPLRDSNGNHLEYDDMGIPSIVRDARGVKMKYDEEGNLIADVFEPREDTRPVVELSDPNAIGWDADGQAAKLLDRYLRPEELSYIIGLVHDVERDNYEQARIAGPGDEIVERSTADTINSVIKMLMPMEGSNEPLSSDGLRERLFSGSSLPERTPISQTKMPDMPTAPNVRPPTKPRTKLPHPSTYQSQRE